MDREKLKEFLITVKRSKNVNADDFLEKDFYITLLLYELDKNRLSESLVFKGGTCLSKAYLDYHRFSEDIDFNWGKRGDLENLSTNKIKKICSEKIGQLSASLEHIAKNYELDFKAEKGNRRYVQLGSNGKQATFKVWYESVFRDTPSFIKVQVSFLEPLLLSPRKEILKPYFNPSSLGSSERIYFAEFVKPYAAELEYYTLDLRELLAEKIRALLTRKKIKGRDMFDIYLIQKKFGIALPTIMEECKQKILFAIKNYEKYMENFQNLTTQELTKEVLIGEDIRPLSLIAIDKKDFDAFTDVFLKELHLFIKGIKEVLA